MIMNYINQTISKISPTECLYRYISLINDGVAVIEHVV